MSDAIRRTGSTHVFGFLSDMESGRTAAPHCEAAHPRLCPLCHCIAVLPLDAATRAKQPDATTHVCHPVLGGCNHGFTVHDVPATEPQQWDPMALADETQDAYSWDRYSSWLVVCRLLKDRGYSVREAEAILRSKWTRWAADASGARYGRAPAKALATFLDGAPDRGPGQKETTALVAGTFGEGA